MVRHFASNENNEENIVIIQITILELTDTYLNSRKMPAMYKKTYSLILSLSLLITSLPAAMARTHSAMDQVRSDLFSTNVDRQKQAIDQLGELIGPQSNPAVRQQAMGLLIQSRNKLRDYPQLGQVLRPYLIEASTLHFDSDEVIEILRGKKYLRGDTLQRFNANMKLLSAEEKRLLEKILKEGYELYQ